MLSGGENVSPAKVEGMLMAEPEISQAVVAGDGRSSLTALVVPADGHDDVGAALAVTRVNHRLSVTERIRKHAVVAPFTVENGLLTPTQKIRRMLVIRAQCRRTGEAARLTVSSPSGPIPRVRHRAATGDETMLCIALRLRWGRWRMKMMFFIRR